MADQAVFDSAHAAELYPELEALEGWSWWWVGHGTASLLVGYHCRDAGAVNVLYIDSDEHATITGIAPPCELLVHETGRLPDVLALLEQGGTAAAP